MKIREMLKQLAIRYEDGGPISRQRDAAALLRLADSLDEESARTYLDRFITKWRIEQVVNEAPLMQASPVVRRRPMPELEQRIYAELALGAPSEETPLPSITIESETASEQEGKQPPAQEQLPAH